MLILLLQSAYNIFLDEPAYQEENTIDVIVRTSQAAIFGYFLSANFANRNIKKKKHTAPPASAAKMAVYMISFMCRTTILVLEPIELPPR